MKNLTRHLLYKGTDIGRQNVLWNIAGSFVYAFASMVLSFLVIRVVGDDQGGIFSFGFSTLGQQMFIVAYFGIRPFQITDNKGEYSFGEYLECRNATCILALVMGCLLYTSEMKASIGLQKDDPYYNSGVLLMDLGGLRREGEMCISDRLRPSYNSFGSRIQWHGIY